jgi:D-isomer specific 2-hydroxyacid dehydrogenase, catalytic domain
MQAQHTAVRGFDWHFGDRRRSDDLKVMGGASDRAGSGPSCRHLSTRGPSFFCVFLSQPASALVKLQVVERLAEYGVRFIAMRCAGFDRVDLEAVYKYGLQIARVPTYSPHR